MSTFGLILIYLLVGLITGLIFKKGFPWRGTTSLTAYLIMGGIFSIIWGLASKAFLDHGYLPSHIGTFNTREVDPAQLGNSEDNFKTTVLWVTTSIAVLGTLLTMIIYRFLFRQRPVG